MFKYAYEKWNKQNWKLNEEKIASHTCCHEHTQCNEYDEEHICECEC